MIFQAPQLSDIDHHVLGLIGELRTALRTRVHEPRRWTASLRRVQFARGVQGSNSIEGYDATLDDALAIDMGEAPLEANTETELALRGYRDAMTYVLQLADETQFRFDEQLLKSLHFMMTGYDLRNRPGRWRPGTIYVREESTGAVVYEGPEVELVAPLMQELVGQLNQDTGPQMVTAALAHLNLVMIHPFSDGNGRMARCLQTLVLAREGILPPVFSSIEEYLGRNTPSYYAILADVGDGGWNPHRDATPWVRYVLTAHYRQAHTMLRRTREIEHLYLELDALIAKHRLHERTIEALFDAASGRRVRNAVYRAIVERQTDTDLAEATATRDLKTLVELGLLQPHGEKRGRYYTAGQPLMALADKVRLRIPARDRADPYLDPDPQIE